MPEPVPDYWGAYAIGYRHMVDTSHHHVNKPRPDTIYNWLRSTFGNMKEGGWIDNCEYICFMNEQDALIFEMIWGI